MTPQPKPEDGNSVHCERFVFLTDLHLGPEQSWLQLKQVVHQIESLSPRPAFLVIGGDCVKVGLPGTDAALERFRSLMAALSLPVYHVAGNHDVCSNVDSPEVGTEADPAAGKAVFLRRAGTRYQRLNWRPAVVLLLDVLMARAGTGTSPGKVVSDIDHQQLLWLSEQLSGCKPGQTVILVSHVALSDPSLECSAGSVWHKVRPCLRDNLNYVNLCGHTHQQSTWRHNAGLSWTTYVGGSLCGMWWRSSGYNMDSTPTGYNIVTANDDGCDVYAKSVETPYAIAAPRFDQVYGQDVDVHWIDTRDGVARDACCNTHGALGWVALDLPDIAAAHAVTAFIAPQQAQGARVDARGRLSLVIGAFLNRDGLSVLVNDQLMGRIEPDQQLDEEVVFLLPRELLADSWNIVCLTGAAYVHSVRLEVAEKRWTDPWVQRLVSRRVEASMGEWEPHWDTSLTQAVTVSRWQRNCFHFTPPRASTR